MDARCLQVARHKLRIKHHTYQSAAESRHSEYLVFTRQSITAYTLSAVCAGDYNCLRRSATDAMCHRVARNMHRIKHHTYQSAAESRHIEYLLFTCQSITADTLSCARR
jgi:hypothetical protein